MKLKALLTILILSIASTGYCTTYQIGSDVSDDYTTWANLQLDVPEADGDIVSFRKGETFKEMIIVPASGSSSSSVILYTSHGTGVDPIISSKGDIPGWATGGNWTTTGKTGDTFSEYFEATGYDETWSDGETIGDGNSLDPNADPADVSAGFGWGDKCFKAITAGVNNSAFVRDDGIGAEAITYYRFEFVLTVLGTDNLNYILETTNVGFGHAFRVQVSNSGDILRLKMYSYHDGNSHIYNSLTTLSLNTNYSVEVKWDATNNLWAWKLDGVAQPNDQDATDPVESEGALTDTHVTEVSKIWFGLLNSSQATTIYLDALDIDTTGWLGGAHNGAWYIQSISKNPYRVWLETTEYMQAETGFVNIDSTHRWWWDDPNDYLYVYAVENPATAYADIEGSFYDDAHALYILDKSYITIDGIQFEGGRTSVYVLANADNTTKLIFNNCTIGKNAGRFGIDILSLNDSYDNTHGTISNCTISSNCTLVYDWDIVAAAKDYPSYGIGLKNGSQNWDVYNNIINDWTHSAVLIEETDVDRNTVLNEVYNNTISFTNVALGRALAFGGSCTTNKFYNNYIKDSGLFVNLGGTYNEFYYNIIDTVTNPSWSASGKAYGIVIRPANTDCDNNKIYNNVIYNTEEPCIFVSDADLVVTVETNDITNNILMNGSTNSLGGFTAGIVLSIDATIDGNTYRTNLMYGSGITDYVDYRGADKTVAEFNLENGNDGNTISGNLAADPLFTDASGGNFKLRWPSPCINAGVDVSLTEDYTGKTIPIGGAFDIGAIETYRETWFKKLLNRLRLFL